MTRLLAVLCLIAAPAYAQALRSYPGQTPGGSDVTAGGGSAEASLPRSFAVYGDSLMVGFCNATTPDAVLVDLLPGYLGVNMAQAGTTTAQIAARYDATHATACAGEPCGTYLIQGGANNCHSLDSCDPETMIADVFGAVDDALEDDRRVIVTNVAPFRDCGPCAGPTAAGWVLAKEYNALFAAACTARPAVTCIDVGAGSPWEQPATDGYLDTDWSCDGIHWLQAATNAWAAEAADAFPEE